MGMFSVNKTGLVTESGINIDEIEAQPCFEENAVDSAYRIMAENQANWNSIMEAVGIDELYVYESTGSEIVYEEGTISGIFTKIKELFKKLIEKVKGVFNKFMTVINSWVKSDKAFVKKYKSDIYKANLKDLEFKGYVFTLDKLGLERVATDGLRDTYKDKVLDRENVKEGSSAEEYTKATKEYRDKKDDILDEIRGDLVYGENSNKKVDSSDFASELFERLRNGESEKDTLDDSDINISDCLLNIENTAKTKSNAEKAYKQIIKGLTDGIKEIDTMSKNLTKELPDKDKNDLYSAKIAYYTSICSLGESTKSLVTIAFGAYIQALKDCNRQCKAICVKALTRKQPKNESASFYEEGGSMLANVSFK